MRVNTKQCRIVRKDGLREDAGSLDRWAVVKEKM